MALPSFLGMHCTGISPIKRTPFSIFSGESGRFFNGKRSKCYKWLVLSLNRSLVVQSIQGAKNEILIIGHVEIPGHGCIHLRHLPIN